jgi:hypothetical protein
MMAVIVAGDRMVVMMTSGRSLRISRTIRPQRFVVIPKLEGFGGGL